MFSDIVSSGMDSAYTEYPLVLVNIANIVYFVSFYSRGYLFYSFTATMVKVFDNNNAWIKQLTKIPLYISCLMAFTSGYTRWIFYIGEDGYHNGPFYNILYFCFYYYIFVSLTIFVLRFKRLRNNRERLSILSYNIILLAGIIVRMMFPRYLLMDTFCLLAIIIIYLSFENPDFYLDDRNGIFNGNALREYLDENKGLDNYTLMAFALRNYKEIREVYGINQMNHGCDMIARFLIGNFDKYLCFNYRSGRFFIIGDRKMDYDMIYEKLEDRFSRSWVDDSAELYLSAAYVVTEPEVSSIDSDTIINGVIETLDKASSVESSDIFYVTRNLLSERKKEIEVKRNLEYAIEHDQVEVFLQPIISSSTGKIVGAEALARLRNKNGKLIPPDEFIKVAESNGRINDLGKQVFAKTCKFIKEHDLAGNGISWVNVNLSPIQFMNPNLAECYSEVVKELNIDPAQIHIEITEAAMVDDVQLKEQIERMSEHGFKFVLDDYGSGYSNLAMLKKCPFICIKLDMSLVWDYCKAPDEILPTMIQAFKHMNFEVTSEGIEDENMAKLMEDIGCEYLQGFYYSEPVSMSVFASRYLENIV